MTWTWTYADSQGASVSTTEPAPTFPNQAEAEDWIGLEWRTLHEQGVSSVTLLEGDRTVYGPMSLDPA
jgi:hypothetical protein